ncbi:MAG: DUF3090 family protein [Candidatus Tectomicrobia bacterium]|nr:DUF3090 family protein [Candidatus Tectomicrobia bacterium]
MADARYDFASVDAIDAESIGEPGKRTFRVRVLEGDQSAALWVEKQLLSALGESLPRLLDQLTTSDQHADDEAEAITLFPDDPTVEFKVGRLALGYASGEDRVVLVAHDVEDGDENDLPPAFSCRFTRQQARRLSEACSEAVAGGRPTCPLCQRPMDIEGHMCPRANGHQKVNVREDAESDEDDAL